MRVIPWFIVFLLLFINVFTYSQDFPIIKYVSAIDGLNVREKPSRTGDRVGTLLYGSRVYLISRSDNPETIDGITDYWYELPPSAAWRHGSGWIFGGYLSSTMPEDTPFVLGRWKIESQDTLYYWDFSPNGWVAHGNPVSGGGLLYGRYSIIGNWTLNENNLIIRDTSFQTSRSSGSNRSETIEATLTVINRDRIVLRFSDNSEHILIRNNDPQ